MKDRASLLIDIIYKNPGLHFCEMIRVSGMKNGVLTHYLNKLESTGIINIQREKKKTRFFSPKISNYEVKIIKFLRKETSRKIILSLLDGGMEFSKITNKVSKSAPTISQNLSELIKNNLIIVKLESSQKKYFIKNNSLLKKIIKKYQFD
ncbi:MAG: winged helix-turn-helix transcriptional regulator [Nitrosopumilus sp.]